MEFHFYESRLVDESHQFNTARSGAPAVKTWKSKIRWSIAGDQTATLIRWESAGVLQEAGGNIEERVVGGYKCSRSKNKGMYRSGGRAEVLSSGVENAEIGNRKLRGRVKTEQTSKKVIQRRLEAINAQSLFSRPPNFYELLFLPQGVHNQYYPETFQNVCNALSSGQGWSWGQVQNHSSSKENYGRRGGP